MPALNGALRAAYLQARYVVEAEGRRIEFRVGARAPRLDALVAALPAGRAGPGEWAFLSAANPRSEVLEPAENLRRQERLRARLGALGPAVAVFPAHGEDPDGKWLPEPGFFAVGLARAEAVGLAREFGQNAIVAGRRGVPGELVACFPEGGAGNGDAA